MPQMVCPRNDVWEMLDGRNSILMMCHYPLSWTKSVENFALSYPPNAYPMDLVPLCPLHLPHPGQSCFIGIRNDPARHQHCFFGRKGDFFSCQCFQELYLETRHGNIYFSQHFCLRLQIWFVVPHGKSASINQKHYLNLCSEETSGGFTKCWLFSQARWLLVNTVHII